MRIAHYLALFITCCGLFLPSLGAHALWDMDEGVNAGCAKEMFEAGTLVVPVFNGELRSAKPVLLYWLQMASFSLGGISELTARLPSAILGLLTVLVTYELARRLFDPRVGLLAGVCLASTIQFDVLSHAATPDAPLMLFVTLTMLLAWLGQEQDGRGWLWWPAIPCGLAVLTKGPIGLAAPGLALLLYFAWNRELRRLFDSRLLTGGLLFLLTVVPWVALVSSETKGEWPERFLKNENVNRIATAQEHHSGPVFYYVVVIILLFAPWSAMIGPTLRHAVRAGLNRLPEVQPCPARFLLTWVVAFVVPFSLVATKLPNYVAPAYPPLAILTAWFLARWARGLTRLSRPIEWVAVGGVLLTGIAFGVGFLVLSGMTPLTRPGDRIISGLETWAWVGLIPIVGAIGMAVGILRDDRHLAVMSLASAAVGLCCVIGVGPVLVVDRLKSQKILATTSGANQTDRDIRLAAARYFQDSESIVFYSGRQVEVLVNAEQIRDFLSVPGRYLYIPEAVWDAELAGKPETPKVRIAARKYDLNRNAVIIVVTTDGV